MERVDIKRGSGKAKVAGTVVCVLGALLLSLYKGEPIIISSQHGVVGDPRVDRAKKFGLGAAFLGVGSVAWSSWFLMQSRIGQYFPHRYSSTLIMSSFSSFQSALLCLVTERDFSKWIVRGGLDVVTVLFSVSVDHVEFDIYVNSVNFCLLRYIVLLCLGNCGIRAMLCGDVLVCEATWPGFYRRV